MTDRFRGGVGGGPPGLYRVAAFSTHPGSASPVLNKFWFSPGHSRLGLLSVSLSSPFLWSEACRTARGYRWEQFTWCNGASSPAQNKSLDVVESVRNKNCCFH